jgi:hypothetical protein
VKSLKITYKVLAVLIFLSIVPSFVLAVTVTKIGSTNPYIQPINNPPNPIITDIIPPNVSIYPINQSYFVFGINNITQMVCSAVNSCVITNFDNYYNITESDALFYLNSNPFNFSNDTTWHYNMTTPAINWVIAQGYLTNESDPIAMVYFVNYYNKTEADLLFYPYSNPFNFSNDTTWHYNMTTPAINFVTQNYYNKTVSDDRFRLHVYEESIKVTTSGGDGSNTSAFYDDWIITQIIYTPSNSNAMYNAEVYESASGNIIDKDRAKHKGEWGIYKYHALVNDSVTVNITNSNPDTTFTVNITYVKNGNAV